MKEKTKSGLLGFLLGAGSGSVATAGYMKMKETDDNYDPHAYYLREVGLWELVVCRDVEQACETFSLMEQRSATPAFGLMMRLSGAYESFNENKREAEQIRESLTDDALRRMESVFQQSEIDMLRLLRESFNRRHGGPRLSSSEMQRIETSLGKDTVVKILNRQP